MVIRKGVYKHYRGDKYIVYGTARYREDPEAIWVIYQKVDTANTPIERLLVRPIELFVEDVIAEDELILRFQLIDPKDDLKIEPRDNYYVDEESNQFDLLAEAKNHETGEEMVIYQAMMDSKKYGPKPLWTTLKDIFFGMENKNGEEVKRFMKVGI